MQLRECYCQPISNTALEKLSFLSSQCFLIMLKLFFDNLRSFKKAISLKIYLAKSSHFLLRKFNEQKYLSSNFNSKQLNHGP